MAVRAWFEESELESADLGAAFLDAYDAESGEVEAARPMREYAELIPEPGFGPLDFSLFPYQLEWYSEEVANAEEVCWRKATQIGMSAYAWRWAVRLADQTGLTVVYIFPTDTHVRDFGDERIEPAIELSPYLRARIQPRFVRHKTLKRIGRGFLHLRGSNSKAGAQSVAAQALVFDEYDFLDQCLIAGTMVLTRRGHVPIEDVVVGDWVLTHRARWRRVLRIGGRVAETRRITAHGVPGIVASDNHPFYARARTGKARDAGVVRKRDPGRRAAESCQVPCCDLPELRYGLCSGHLQRQHRHGVVADSPIRPVFERGGRIVSATVRRGQAEWTVAADLSAAHYLARVLAPVESDSRSVAWWWFVGRYLADGCCDRNSVHLDVGESKVDEARERLGELFDNVRVRPYPNARCSRLTVSSRRLVAELACYGRLAHGKRLTGHALSLSAEKSKALLAGYLSGDGSYDEPSGTTSCVTVSRALALGVVMLIHRVYGVAAGCAVCAPASLKTLPVSAGGRTVNARQQYRVSFRRSNIGPFVEDGVMWLPVRSVETMGSREVFNLTVDEDESFVADGCVVHNSNLPQIERRISGARQLGYHPKIRRLGTPTIEGHGISAAFDASDQRLWIVTCDECGHQQDLSWEESLRWRNESGGAVMRAGQDDWGQDPNAVAEVWRACKRCGESLERDVPRGRWVAQHPTRRVIGFAASRLIVPNTDLRQIVKASRKTKPADVEAFENNDLGRPYSAAEASLDMATLLACCERGGPVVPANPGQMIVTIGVDVAGERDLNVRVDEQLAGEEAGIPNPRRAIWIGRVPDFPSLVELVYRYRAVSVAVDANPERRSAKALRASFAPGTVVLVNYTARADAPVMKIAEVGEAGTPLEGIPLSVTVQRTEAIDAMMDSYRQLRNFPLRDPPAGWFEQMRALKRRTVLDNRGNAQRVYVTTGTAGDDYAHADVYALIATELWRLRGGANLMRPPERLVPDEEIGFRRLRLTDSGDNLHIYGPGFGSERDV